MKKSIYTNLIDKVYNKVMGCDHYLSTYLDECLWIRIGFYKHRDFAYARIGTPMRAVMNPLLIIMMDKCETYNFLKNNLP